jgi:hypothetical protein
MLTPAMNMNLRRIFIYPTALFQIFFGRFLALSALPVIAFAAIIPELVFKAMFKKNSPLV